MPVAMITFDFDPVVHFGGFSARIETLAIAGVVLVAILLAARIGAITATVSPLVPPPTLLPSELLPLIVGVIPGAVIGGRLEHVLTHFDFYRANPGLTVDPAVGGFGLALAVLGGTATAWVATRAFGLASRPWAHALTLPMLFVLSAGKLVGVFGGTGQGAPTDLSWATAYTGTGPWGTLHAEIASHPAQAYEAVGAFVVLLALGLLFRAGVFERQDGSAFFAGLGLWALARFAVAFTWRDAAVAGPIGAAQVMCLFTAAVCVVAVVVLRRASRTTSRMRTIGAATR